MTQLASSATPGAGSSTPPVDIPVGRVEVVADPFGKVLVLVDLSKARYATDAAGNLTVIAPDP